MCLLTCPVAEVNLYIVTKNKLSQFGFDLYIPENCTCSGATFQFSAFRIALENVKYFH